MRIAATLAAAFFAIILFATAATPQETALCVSEGHMRMDVDKFLVTAPDAVKIEVPDTKQARAYVAALSRHEPWTELDVDRKTEKLVLVKMPNGNVVIFPILEGGTVCKIASAASVFHEDAMAHLREAVGGEKVD